MVSWLLVDVFLNLELFFASPPNISARLETKLIFLVDSDEVFLFSLSLPSLSGSDL